jgi:Rhomboid family
VFLFLLSFQNWKESEHGLVQIFVSVVYCAISIIVAATDPAYKVSHVAHLCGGLAGLLVGFRVLQNLNLERWENTLRRLSLAIFSLLILVGLVYFYVPQVKEYMSSVTVFISQFMYKFIDD